MSQTRVLVLLAGAALSIGAPALAQNAHLDLDRAYSAELIADSGARTSQLAAGGSAGFNNGAFGFSDGTGANTLNIGGTDQFREKLDFRKSSAVGGSHNSFTHGFQDNDIRLRFYGTIATQDLAYKIQINGEQGQVVLEDAWAKYNFENGFSVMWGQFVDPIYRERIIDSEKQLAVERSQTERFFDPDYTQGVEFIYAQDMWRIMFGFNDGTNTRDTVFNSGAEQDFAIGARVDVIVTGSSGWARWDDFTSWKNQDMGILLGAAFNYEQSGNTNPGTANSPKTFDYTVDASFEGQGWNAFAAILGTHMDPDNTTPKIDDIGLVVQGGIFVADQWELFARWDMLHFDKDTLPGGVKRNEHFLTGGVNYYLSPNSHAAKFTADVVIALTKTDGLTARGGLPDVVSGTLGQAQKAGEVTFRVQGQVEF